MSPFPNFLRSWMSVLAAAAIMSIVLPPVTIAQASEFDRFDFASVTLQPAYISPTLMRQSSCLRAIAISPPARTPASTDQRVVIAVGDAGVILRSDDQGQTWRAVENIQSSVPPASTQFGRSAQRTADSLAMPFCNFTDVLWASPVDVIVVGGGYEPVTGISRGVCILSRDGGRTWHLGDAHELPRLHKLRMGGPSSQVASLTASPERATRELGPGVLEAIGDASEASGVNRFHSYDGGQTWVEDIRVADPSEASQQTAAGGGAAATLSVIQTAALPITVNSLTRPGDGWQFAVASHGRIWRRSDPDSAWQAVRGQGRGVAVLFVAASPAEVPWSLVGRESLHENRRTAIVLDTAENGESTHNDVQRCRAAAAMLGISDVYCVTKDDERTRWLSEHRPAVVVLDESLTIANQHAWSALIEHARTRPFSESQAGAGSDWGGPVRIVLTRHVAAREQRGRTKSVSHEINTDPRWQRAWNHTSVLRGNALLSGPGVLAHDLAVDALMMAAPQQSPAAGVEVATFDDTSGSVRRDFSLAAGLALKDGQNREPAETLTASNRRLQITTARMNQSQRLHEELFQQSSGIRSGAEQTRLREKIEQFLAVTAAEDRTRLLWDAMAVTMTAEQESPQVRSLLLSLISRHGQPAAVRRWAEVNQAALESSVERRSLTSLDQLTDRRTYPSRVLGNVADNLDRAAGPGTASATETMATPSSVERGQSISPFQIPPVTHDREPPPSATTPSQRVAELPAAVPQNEPSPPPNMPSAQRTAPAYILVPETKPVEWQPTRGWTALATPLSASASAAALKSVPSDDDDEPARINWDYHPVVLAARGIMPQARATGASTPDSPALGQSAGSESARKAPVYAPPHTAERPLLDGLDDDTCWTAADHWLGAGYGVRWIADDEYLYFTISATRADQIRLALDCDGDYFTALRFEINRDGARRVRVDTAATIFPVWFSATAPQTRSLPADDSDGPWVAEIAIARSSLPAPVCRVQVCPANLDTKSQWEVIPNASLWYPKP